MLTPDSITVEAGIEAGHYTSYEEFARRFSGVWAALVEHFKPVAVLQQGLRYVNHIERELSPAGWSTLINPELLGSITTTLGGGLVQAMCDLRFQREDGMLAFKHGLVQAGPENKLGYLLDFDCFGRERARTPRSRRSMGRFDRDHETIYDFFRWCVTEQALKEFRDAG